MNLKKIYITLLCSVLCIGYHAIAQTPDRLNAYVCKLKNGTIRTVIDSVNFAYYGGRKGIPTYNFGMPQYLVPDFSIVQYDNAINTILPGNRFHDSSFKQYDVNGNLILEMHYVCVYTSIRVERTRYTYDVMNRLICRDHDLGFSTIAPISWEYLKRDTFIYDVTGNILQQNTVGISLPPKVISPDTSGYRYDFIYAAGNLVSKIRYQKNNNGPWVPADTTIYTYNTNNDMIHSITNYYTGTGFDEHLCTYNSSHMLLADSINQKNSTTAMIWKPSVFNQMSYSSSGKMLLHQYKLWNTVTSAWDTSETTISTYDANDNLITYQHKYPGVDTLRTICQYNSNNQVSFMHYEVYNKITSAWYTPVIDTERYFYYGSSTGVHEMSKSKLNCSVYPNPASDCIQLDINSTKIDEEYYVIVHNSYGQLIQQNKVMVNGSKHMTIPTSGISSGTCYITIKNATDSWVYPFVISH